MNICQLAQRSFVAWLKTHEFNHTPADQIYHGIDNQVASDTPGDDGELNTHRKLPCVVVECNQATEAIQDAGNWDATVRVEIRSSADDDTDEEHQERVNEIIQTLFTSTIAEDLTDSFPALQVQQVIAGDQGYEIAGRAWVSVFQFGVFCFGSLD